jgi:hypothetical protein
MISRPVNLPNVNMSTISANARILMVIGFRYLSADILKDIEEMRGRKDIRVTKKYRQYYIFLLGQNGVTPNGGRCIHANQIQITWPLNANLDSQIHIYQYVYIYWMFGYLVAVTGMYKLNCIQDIVFVSNLLSTNAN